MNRAWILLALAAGCSKSAPADPPAPPVARGAEQQEGSVYTGFPESRALAVCDARGRWGVGTPAVAHWLEDGRTPMAPEDGAAALTLFRDALPFPVFSWKAGDFEVKQTLFPSGAGYVIRYHVMNHGAEARAVKLLIGSRDGARPDLQPVDPPSQKTERAFVFDLTVEPGVSKFVHLTTPELGGKLPERAIDDAADRWEKILQGRGLVLPDVAAATAYHAALAANVLGVKGSEDAIAQTERLLARREGNAIRLLPAVPEKWHLEAIEVRELPTDFGPLSFRYQGAYNNRAFELQPGCKPPDGFLIALPDKLVARIDGKDAPAEKGLIRVPAGAKVVEFSYPR